MPSFCSACLTAAFSRGLNSVSELTSGSLPWVRMIAQRISRVFFILPSSQNQSESEYVFVVEKVQSKLKILSVCYISLRCGHMKITFTINRLHSEAKFDKPHLSKSPF